MRTIIEEYGAILIACLSVVFAFSILAAVQSQYQEYVQMFFVGLLSK